MMQHLMSQLAKQDILLEVNQEGFRIEATDITDWISLKEDWSTDYDTQEDQVIDAVDRATSGMVSYHSLIKRGN